MAEPLDMASADAPGGHPKRQQERVDRWGEVHTVTWDAKRAMWAGALQGHGIKGEELRAWWPRDALSPWEPSGAHGAPGAATSGPGAGRAPEGPGKSKIPADEVPF